MLKIACVRASLPIVHSWGDRLSKRTVASGQGWEKQGIGGQVILTGRASPLLHHRVWPRSGSFNKTCYYCPELLRAPFSSEHSQGRGWEETEDSGSGLSWVLDSNYSTPNTHTHIRVHLGEGLFRNIAAFCVVYTPRCLCPGHWARELTNFLCPSTSGWGVIQVLLRTSLA